MTREREGERERISCQGSISYPCQQFYKSVFNWGQQICRRALEDSPISWSEGYHGYQLSIGNLESS